MKKSENLVILLALSIIATCTFDIAAVSKKQKRQQRRSLQQQRRQHNYLVQQKLNKERQSASPELKKTIVQNTADIQKNTATLEESIKKAQGATTFTDKQAAQENVFKAMEELQKSLQDKRSWEGDLYSGYEKKQVERAQAKYKELDVLKKKVISVLNRKKEALEKVTKKGFIWNTALPGKETEFNTISTDITQLTELSSRIDSAMRDQEIITGEKWSNAYKALVGAVATLGSLAAWQYGPTAIEATKTGVKSVWNLIPSWRKPAEESTTQVPLASEQEPSRLAQGLSLTLSGLAYLRTAQNLYGFAQGLYGIAQGLYSAATTDEEKTQAGQKMQRVATLLNDIEQLENDKNTGKINDEQFKQKLDQTRKELTTLQTEIDRLKATQSK